jgi:hypothetical protein
MADYFTNFSLAFKLKDGHGRQYAVDLAGKAAGYRTNDEPVPGGFPTSLVEVLEDWSFETKAADDSIWLHSQYGSIDAACAFIRHLLEKFDPEGCVTFEWSHDCTKPRTDAYGGGAAIITAREIKTMNTADWIRSNLPEELTGQKHVFSPQTLFCTRCGKHANDDAVENTPCRI